MFFTVKNKLFFSGLISLASFSQIINSTTITINDGGMSVKVVSPQGQEPNMSTEVSASLPLTLEANFDSQISEQLKNKGGLTTDESQAVISLAHIIAKSWDPSSGNPINFEFENEDEAAGRRILEKAKIFLKKNLKKKLGSSKANEMLEKVLINENRVKLATCLCFCAKGTIQALSRGGSKQKLASAILEITKDSVFSALTGEASIIDISSDLLDVVI